MRVRDEERERYVFLRTKIHERHGANKKFQKKRQNKRKEERGKRRRGSIEEHASTRVHA